MIGKVQIDRRCGDADLARHGLVVASVQLGDPTVSLAVDNDIKGAVATRKAALVDAAKNGYIVALAHVPFPGLGHLGAEGSGYRWYPVNYTFSPSK